MRTSTSYNHQARLKTLVRDIFSSSKSYHLSHGAILDRIVAKVYQDPAWCRVPAHVRIYIGAIIECEFNTINRYHLAWRIYWRGSLVESSVILPGTWNECESGKGAHVWNDRPERIYFGGPDNVA